MTLDTLREQRGFLPVMRLRNRPAGGLKGFPWNALFGQRVRKLRREGAVHLLVNSQVLPSIFFTLKSQITPTFILPVGVKMSELETNRK